ncbi:hypothetical protein [Pseudogemmobacter sp. W21_MBD1_M6]|uniref:hypothetical protein n=1 Tax=Pseudogemmobacter sp. W21_MBD1_M6 TaxID=3240271 RepID=UPI003F98DA28
MATETIEQMTHFAIEHVLANANGWRSVVRELVRLWPTVDIEDIPFAVVSAAAAIEGMFDQSSPSRKVSARAYQMAALLGTDMYAMRHLGLRMETAQDLASYWADHDPYFLTL